MNTDSDKADLYNLLIIGAGPAGLAAALEAGKLGWKTALVEQASQPGGKSYEYTCKADDECRVCGVCQVCESSDKVLNSPETIHTFLNHRAVSCEKNDNDYVVKLIDCNEQDSTFSIKAEKILMTTGFEPFDLTEKPALGYGRYRNVISLEILEKHLKINKTIDTLIPAGTGAKKPLQVAFVQCVGSRDTTNNGAYCSQVCCRVALKLSNLLKKLDPDIEPTIFYMDLQTLDNPSSDLAAPSKGIRLIRSLPGEIRRESNQMLTLRYDDLSAGTQVEASYHLVVLAGAIRPALPMEDMSGLPEIVNDEIGFWKLSEADKSNKSINVAGAASGPMDILSAMTHGRYIIRQMAAELEDMSDELL